ncbi:MAG: MATE family efflux transporter [Bacillaceae bacterium]
MSSQKQPALLKQFLNYAIPSVLAMLVFSVYTMVDGIFVAKGVGETALAAVNIAMPFINSLFALSLWFAVGASTLIAIAMGKGETKKANELFTMNTVILIIISIIITVLALTNLDSLAYFLGANDAIIPYVTDYLRIVIVFSAFFIVSYCLEVLVKTDGFPVLATLGACASALTNIVLDYFFVIKFGWGIEGAAYATGISQVVLLAIFLVHFMISKKSNLTFSRFTWKLGVYKRVLSIGFSDCITEFSTGIVIFLFNWSILATIGQDGVVSYTIISYVNTLMLMVMIGLTQGMQPLVSFYYGQNRMKLVHKLLRYALVSAAICGAIAFVVCQIGANYLVGIFIDPAHIDLTTYSTVALKMFSASFLILGFNVVIGGFFAAIEQPKRSLMISISRGLLLVPVGLASMIILFGAGKLWFATAVSETICLVIAFFLLTRYLKQHRQPIVDTQPKSA